MNQLPDLMRRAPKIFYVLAFLFAAASFGLSYWEISVVTLPYAEPGNAAVSVSLMRSLYSALSEATYIAASGALVDIAIRIWDKMPSKEAAE